jgi:hypothetical protein
MLLSRKKAGKTGLKYAGMAELEDVPDLGSGVERRAGSNPVTRTNERPTILNRRSFILPVFMRLRGL